MASRLQLALGTCAGVLAGLGLAHLTGSRTLPSTGAVENTLPSAALHRTEALESAAAPVASVEPQSARSEAQVSSVARMGVLEVLEKAGPLSQEHAERLPSLRRMLLDPELNPERRECTDPGQRKELEELIAAHNRELLDTLEQQHTGLMDTFLAGKIAAGVDAPSTWKMIPREELVISCQVTIGTGEQLGTVLRKGESPEIEELAQRIEAAREVARSELRDRIALLSPR